MRNITISDDKGSTYTFCMADNATQMWHTIIDGKVIMIAIMESDGVLDIPTCHCNIAAASDKEQYLLPPVFEEVSEDREV